MRTGCHISTGDPWGQGLNEDWGGVGGRGGGGVVVVEVGGGVEGGRGG